MVVVVVVVVVVVGGGVKAEGEEGEEHKREDAARGKGSTCWRSMSEDAHLLRMMERKGKKKRKKKERKKKKERMKEKERKKKERRKKEKRKRKKEEREKERRERRERKKEKRKMKKRSINQAILPVSGSTLTICTLPVSIPLISSLLMSKTKLGNLTSAPGCGHMTRQKGENPAIQLQSPSRFRSSVGVPSLSKKRAKSWKITTT